MTQGFTSSNSLNFDKLDPTKAHHILIHHIGDDARIYKTEEQNIPIKDSEPDKTDDSEGSDNPSNSGDSNKTNGSSNTSSPSNPSNPNDSTNPDPSEPPKPPEEPEDNHFGDLLRELDVLKHNAFSEQTENLDDRIRGIFHEKPKHTETGKTSDHDKSKKDKENSNDHSKQSNKKPQSENHQENHPTNPSINQKDPKTNILANSNQDTPQSNKMESTIPSVPDSGMPRYLKKLLYSKQYR